MIYYIEMTCSDYLRKKEQSRRGIRIVLCPYCLILKSIEFDIDGVTLWYEDDMFWGHAVMVVCSETGEANFADMLG